MNLLYYLTKCNQNVRTKIIGFYNFLSTEYDLVYQIYYFKHHYKKENMLKITCMFNS